MLTAVLWSKVGVTAPFFALVERMHQNWPVLKIYAAEKEVAVRVHVERSP